MVKGVSWGLPKAMLNGYPQVLFAQLGGLSLLGDAPADGKRVLLRRVSGSLRRGRVSEQGFKYLQTVYSLVRTVRGVAP
jgi:hypothetical protein